MSEGARRVFLALALGPQAGLELFEQVLPSLGGEEAGRDFRLARPEGLHLTLYFLGPRAEDSLERLREEVHAACSGLAGPRLAWEGTGCFPRRGKESVLWVGVREEPKTEGRLQALHTAVLAALERCGVDTRAVRARPFRPHVTVARPRRPGRVPAAFYTERPPGGFSAPELTLLESVTGGGPARYLPVWTVPLQTV